MDSYSPREVGRPNPALEPFGVLIGRWETTGTHGQEPENVLHGQVSVEWLEGGAFLLMRSSLDDPRFPGTVTIIGSDDAQGEFYMLTFDSRGVSRKYDASLRDNVWKWWRDEPGFRQRYEAVIEDGGDTLVGKGELSEDGGEWKPDLNLTYRRVE